MVSVVGGPGCLTVSSAHIPEVGTSIIAATLEQSSPLFFEVRLGWVGVGAVMLLPSQVTLRGNHNEAIFENFLCLV